jgi:hypothetical protein
MKQECCCENTPEWLVLQQAYMACRVREEALRDALDDLKQCKLVAAELDTLCKKDRRLLDQFAYRSPACKMTWVPG